MKTDDTSNSKPNNCPLQRSLGKSFSLLIPTSKNSSKIKSNPVIRRLVQQFDNVYATPVQHCSTPRESKCKSGVRAEALRRNHKQGSKQDYSDTATVLKLVHDDLGKTDGVRLLDIKGGITIYSMKCRNNADSSDRQ